MSTLKTLSCAAAIAIGLAAPACGADMLFPPQMGEGGRPGLVELGTGWYLRGDIGYVDYAKPKEGRGSIINDAFDQTTLKNTWSAGAGFGYKFLNVFRADVTVDHRFAAAFEGISVLGGGDRRRDWGKLDSTTGLVNAYVDLGTWYGVTPYVGAGVGVAMNHLQDYRTRLTCVTPACGPLGDQSLAEVPAHRSYDLAWAVMGGIAVDLGVGLQVDVGYRYANLSEASLRDNGTKTTRSKDIEAHELRLGLRYMIDN